LCALTVTASVAGVFGASSLVVMVRRVTAYEIRRFLVVAAGVACPFSFLPALAARRSAGKGLASKRSRQALALRSARQLAFRQWESACHG
jgi:hypothetical protein